MSATPRELATQIHAAGRPMLFMVTGGGATAIAELLATAGGSRTVVEAIVPYSAEALSHWLGAIPDSFCSQETARAMAMVAYRRAQLLKPNMRAIAGIGATSSLTSDRPKRGPHRIHVAIQARDQTTCASIELEKGRRSRAEEERVAANLILNAAAEFSGIGDRLESGLGEGELVCRTSTTAPSHWQQLVTGEVAYIRLGPGSTTDALPAVVFPGAFNPLHEGHEQMARIAASMLGAAVAMELSIENVDKPPLDFMEIEKRLAQFDSSQSVWLTRASTFVEKAAIFPGATFIVGADTLSRIADWRYYADDRDALHAIDLIAAAGCRFLVFGRAADDHFQTLADLKLPAALEKLCTEVPASTFRNDVSSTRLRQSGVG